MTKKKENNGKNEITMKIKVYKEICIRAVRMTQYNQLIPICDSDKIYATIIFGLNSSISLRLNSFENTFNV
jgi:hypothetical protein